MVIVLTMVTISGILRLVQEQSSRRAADRLTQLVRTTATVQRTVDRASQRLEIPMEELVVGDLIHLAAGDMIPADVRILQAKDLFVGQSSLTGESEPVEKFGGACPQLPPGPLEAQNLCFLGSNVVSGSAAAVVVATGPDTQFGAIAAQLQEAKTVTGFDKGVSSVSKLLIRFMLIMAPAVLVVSGLRSRDWASAALFALSVAVGLTPEMLPMLVSANLAKGAVSLSRQKVVVKNLSAIENLGAMDVLCTDKTGTLTQDQVVLQYHLNVHGQDDPRVLRHGCLNSYHQTGLKNLMDRAIIDRAKARGMADLFENYRKVDEIPFDFSRRRMSVVVEDHRGKTQLITKGAIEEMLGVCAWADVDGAIQPMTEALRQRILATCKAYSADGLRVLGVAHKTNPAPAGQFSVADEADMVLIGYLAFLDPPKPSAKQTIADLRGRGVAVKVLTGDSDMVTQSVCRQVGIPADWVMLGPQVEELDDERLRHAVGSCDVFAKLSPRQKARVVAALRQNGHTVGFLGDGINDAAAMKQADVGISVDTAVDIAKESADIILLEKDLTVLSRGVIEGRRIHANIMKYIQMTVSSNFGNMLSVLVASVLLPFLPMLPLQLLVLNLIYDISCIAIPWDHADASYLAMPQKWDASSIARFMLRLGPVSSIIDLAMFALLYFVVCPGVTGGAFVALDAVGQENFAALFHTGWFLASLWTQTMVIHMIRTERLPFIRSRAAWQLTVMTLLGVSVGTAIACSPLGAPLGMALLPNVYFCLLAGLLALYLLLATGAKHLYLKRYGRLF